MLSSISTVVEFTLVSVPFTNKSPLIVTLDPVNCKPVSTDVWKVSKSLILVACDPLLVSKLSNLPSNEPVVVSNVLLKVPTSTPSTFPVKVILPVIIKPFPKTIEFPSDDRTLLPAVIWIGASNSILPVPDDVSVISPFSD